MVFGLKGTHRASLAEGSPINEKQLAYIDTSPVVQQAVDIADHEVQPGELSLEEDTAGGMGRHLGVYSLTFLM